MSTVTSDLVSPYKLQPPGKTQNGQQMFQWKFCKYEKFVLKYTVND